MKQLLLHPFLIVVPEMALLMAALILLIQAPALADQAYDKDEFELAFVANVDGNWDLYVSTRNGDKIRQLTDTPYDEMNPDWSPDGRFVAVGCTDGIIRIISVESLEQKAVMPIDSTMLYDQPRFSPDGELLAVSIQYRSTTDATDVGLINLGTQSVTIPLDQQSLQLFPSWSPDARSLYYTFASCSMPCGRIIQDVWCYDFSASLPRQVLLTNAHCRSPVVSPDGETIAFAANIGSAFDLWLCGVDGDSLRQLTADAAFDTSPTWDADGARIVFASTRDGDGLGIFDLEVETGIILRIVPLGKDVECKDPDLK
ncbi:MAG: hypothetical protein ABIK83_13740 [Candidatus Zixiibacteriota bacterium]